MGVNLSMIDSRWIESLSCPEFHWSTCRQGLTELIGQGDGRTLTSINGPGIVPTPSQGYIFKHGRLGQDMGDHRGSSSYQSAFKTDVLCTIGSWQPSLLLHPFSSIIAEAAI